MRLGSTLLAFMLTALIGSAGQAQFERFDPVEKEDDAPKAKAKPAVKKPVAKPRKTQPMTARAIRMQRAQAEAAMNAFIFPPLTADPLGIAPGAVVVPGGGAYGPNNDVLGLIGGGAYVDPNFATDLNAAIRTRDYSKVIPQRGPGATASGGMANSTDSQLIHGYDGDGNGELPPTPGVGYNPRVEKVKGGSYVQGAGILVRKGEPVYRGTFIPGLGVIGQSIDQTQGGAYRPGYGVVGGGANQGFGVNAAQSYYSGNNGNAGFYSGSSLLNNNYGNNGNAGFYGGSSLLNNNYGGNGNAGFYGGSSLTANHYGGIGNANLYNGPGLLNNNYGGNGNAGFYGGTGLLNNNYNVGNSGFYSGPGSLQTFSVPNRPPPMVGPAQ